MKQTMPLADLPLGVVELHIQNSRYLPSRVELEAMNITAQTAGVPYWQARRLHHKGYFRKISKSKVAPKSRPYLALVASKDYSLDSRFAICEHLSKGEVLCVFLLGGRYANFGKNTRMQKNL